MTLVITGLAAHHDRSDFDCGEPALNNFLQRLARQQAQRDFNRTYVAVSDGDPRVRGFYALSSASIDFEHWPAGLHLPRYPVPVARIGRLAVAVREQGNRIGEALLRHAMHLGASLAEQIGLHAMVVDAKDEAAVAFYMRYGFQRFPDQALRLFLPTQVIRRALATAAKGASR
jgi:ribosomal protein S18 acetylase RimI-like enzyme